MLKNEICIYCGERESTRKGDHVPPQCFFGDTRGHALIQVPCCEKCNGESSKDDEIIRNMLVSIEGAADHLLVESQLREKRNRSLVRETSNGNVTDRSLRHLLESTSEKDRFSEDGKPMGKWLALKGDQPAMHRFLDRMTRALHHQEYKTGFVKCEIQDSNVFDENIAGFISKYSPSFHGELGEDVFYFAGYTLSDNKSSIFYMRFFGHVEFWTALWTCN